MLLSIKIQKLYGLEQEYLSSILCFCPEAWNLDIYVAGLLTYSFPERLPIRPWRSVAWYVRELTEITAAGTVADSHGIPFSSGTRIYTGNHNGDKFMHYFYNPGKVFFTGWTKQEQKTGSRNYAGR